MTNDSRLDLQLVTSLSGGNAETNPPDDRGTVVVLAKSDSGRTMALVINSN